MSFQWKGCPPPSPLLKSLHSIAAVFLKVLRAFALEPSYEPFIWKPNDLKFPSVQRMVKCFHQLSFSTAVLRDPAWNRRADQNPKLIVFTCVATFIGNMNNFIWSSPEQHDYGRFEESTYGNVCHLVGGKPHIIPHCFICLRDESPSRTSNYVTK